MPYRTARTECRVHLVMLRHLPATTLAQCQTLRQEAGRLWTGLVAMHAQARLAGQWPPGWRTGESDEGRAVRPGQPDERRLSAKSWPPTSPPPHQLRRQEANCDRAHPNGIPPPSPSPTRRSSGRTRASSGIVPGCIGLKSGQGQSRTSISPCRTAIGEPAFVGWSCCGVRDHYELALTLDPRAGLAHASSQQATIVGTGIDLGEVHVAAITTTRRHALVLSGRLLRSFKQWPEQESCPPQRKAGPLHAGLPPE